jgi:hypothetical protein
MVQKVQEFTMSNRAEADVPFGTGIKMPKPFNVGPRYGGATISLNNKNLFICSCTKQAGIFNCDIFSTKYEVIEVDGKEERVWSELKNLGPNINGPNTWEAQPSLSADGKTLYFASARAESIQQSIDIYYSEKQPDGSWGKAINCGRPINTIGNDKAPFMHSDSKTLYFVSQCSQERLGAGGYDLFYTRQNDDGTWDRPENMGYPINTEGDEEGIIVSADGDQGYIASNGIKGGIGKKDIFSFNLPEEAKPDKVIIMKGKVDAENIEEIRDAKLKVRFQSGKVVEQEISISEEGDYVAIANVGSGKEDVLIEIEKEGVLTKRMVFAALRYERWLDLNHNATLRARTTILQELYQQILLDIPLNQKNIILTNIIEKLIQEQNSENVSELLNTIKFFIQKDESLLRSFEKNVSLMDNENIKNVITRIINEIK